VVPETSTVETFDPIFLVKTTPEPSLDFISSYADWADVFEAPRAAHEWIAALLVAAALNGNVFIEWGGGSSIPLDLWVLLLSESGQGRNTITSLAMDVAEASGVPGLIHRASWGSKQALYQQLASSPRGLYDWPEFSEVLRSFNDPKFAGAKEWFTDRYDRSFKRAALTPPSISTPS
jgi:hypothetical protein